MEKRKILRYEKPKENSSLYVIYFDSGNGKEYKAYLSKESFEVLMLEQKLLEAGVDGKVLEEYKEAVYMEASADSDEETW